ncbi:MAG TPA: pirin family protein, partial [Verrucomicrobiota bacterium]|nr:pirin family protein [Verrucomicrobiota bacterium]
YAEKSMTDAAPGRLHLVASRTGRGGSLAIHQDADLYLGRFAGGDAAELPLRPGRHAWVQVAEGEVELNGHALKAGDGAALSDEAAVRLQARGPAQALLFDLD